MAIPRPRGTLGWLLLINIVVFVVQKVVGLDSLFANLFAVVPDLWWQPWRYVTFQFLHAGFSHIFFNMLILFFLGMYLSRDWGGRRFLQFYLACGITGGVLHVVLTPLLNQPTFVPLMGASGGCYGVLLACAVFYPQIKLYVYFIFPVSIRVIAAVFLGVAVLAVIAGLRVAAQGGTLEGGISHPAHLGGAMAAAVWIWVLPKLRRRRLVRASGAGRWEKKLQRERELEEKVDEILAKIRREGFNSLNRREKRILKQATDQQRGQGL